jgi:hypothetical protein
MDCVIKYFPFCLRLSIMALFIQTEKKEKIMLQKFKHFRKNNPIMPNQEYRYLYEPIGGIEDLQTTLRAPFEMTFGGLAVVLKNLIDSINNFAFAALRIGTLDFSRKGSGYYTNPEPTHFEQGVDHALISVHAAVRTVLNTLFSAVALVSRILTTALLITVLLPIVAVKVVVDEFRADADPESAAQPAMY